MPLRSFTTAELSLTERKRLEQPLLVMIWLGVVIFSLAERQFFYVVAGTLVVALNLLVVRQGKEVSLRRTFVNVAVLIATCVLFLEMFVQGLPAILALGHYLILIQLCKLFERKRNRDYVQMIALSLTTVVAAGLINQDLWFAMMLAVYLVVAARVTMIFTLKRGLDAAASARLPVESRPLPPDRVAWNVIRHWPGKALRRRLALVLVVVAANAVVTFFLVPRTDLRADLMPGRVETVGGGPGQEVRLGDAKTIKLSDQVIMQVRMEGDASHAGPLYLRGAVYERYSSSRWSQSPEASWAGPQRSAGPPPQDHGGRALTKRVSMHPSLMPTVYAVYPAVRLEPEKGQARYNALLSAEIEVDDSPSGPMRYAVTSWLPPLTERQRQYLDTLSDGPPARFAGDSLDVVVPPGIGNLARQWLRDMPAERPEESDLAIAGYIRDRLSRDYGYTLDLPAAEKGRDAVEDFLFRTRRGHCEYFASAMALMCNALDVRARLAVGFLADERDERTGYYIVRRRDAHAWVEVFTPETDWVIFDPTPGDHPERTRVGFWHRARVLWTSMQFAWYDRVVGYDADTQQALARRLRRWAINVTHSVRAGIGQLGRSVYVLLVEGYVDRVAVGLLAALIITAAMLWVIILVRFLRRRMRRRRRQADPRLLAQTRLSCIPELLAELERRGLPQRADWTLRRRAAEAAGRFHLPEDALMELVWLYYRLRWGGWIPDEAEVRAAELRVRDLRGRLAA